MNQREISEVSVQRSAFSGQRSAVSGRRSAIGDQRSEGHVRARGSRSLPGPGVRLDDGHDSGVRVVSHCGTFRRGGLARAASRDGTKRFPAARIIGTGQGDRRRKTV